MAKKKSDNGYSLSQLQDMLTAGHSRLDKLRERESKLETELEGVRAEMASLNGGEGAAPTKPRRGRPPGSTNAKSGASPGAKTGAKRGRRPRNAMNLPDTIASVLTDNGGPMAVADLTAAILATGYKSNSENFRGIVNQALIKDDRFTAASRGVYGFADGQPKEEAAAVA